MGLDIVSFNVQNFVDGNGVIENLGVDNIVKIQKNAAISRAVSERDIAQAQKPKHHRKQMMRKSLLKRLLLNNELAIKKAELKKLLMLNRQKLMQLIRFKKNNLVNQ